MTRETKVGLVVAGSFLCLVGVVVASRLRRNADDASRPEAESVSPKPDATSPDKTVVPHTASPQASHDNHNNTGVPPVVAVAPVNGANGPPLTRQPNANEQKPVIPPPAE